MRTFWSINAFSGRRLCEAGGSKLRSVAVSLVALVIAVMPISTLPSPGLRELTLAVVHLGNSLHDVAAAAGAVDGRLVWTDPGEAVWIIALGPEANA